MDDAEQAITILNNQLPDYFKPIIEFQEILKVHGYALGEVNRKAAQMQANFYIATCDEPTITYYEKLFEIKYRIGDTLDFRRTRVLQKFNTIVPFSIGFLRNKLTELYGENGYTLDVDSVSLTLKIKVTSDRYGAIDLLYDLLWDVVPAHIRIIANQQTTNFVPGRIYTGGHISGSTRIQTIHYQTINEIKNNANTIGSVSKLSIQTIEAGGLLYGGI